MRYIFYLVSIGMLTSFALTDDLIRLIPTNVMVPAGYLFAFLSTWMAQALISKDE